MAEKIADLALNNNLSLNSTLTQRFNCKWRRRMWRPLFV